MNFDYKKRIEKLRRAMQESEVDLLLFGGADRLDANAYYYSGDEAFPSILLISQEKAVIYSTQCADALPCFFEVLPFRQWNKNVKNLVEKLKPERVGFDQRSDTLGFFAFEKANYKKMNFTKQFLTIRSIKEEKEVQLIKKAQEITKKAVAETLQENLNGLSEKQVVGKIGEKVLEYNVFLDAFSPLVQNGERSAVFHSATTGKKIDFSKSLLIDVGAKYAHYCADYSFTFYKGNDKFTCDALQAVQEAQKQAQRTAEKQRNGKKAGDKALAVLKEYGFEKDTYKDVGLGLGHAVGLEVHDGTVSIDKIEKLQKGMCYTVEPGLYFPKKFGVRFEDVAFI